MLECLVDSQTEVNIYEMPKEPPIGLNITNDVNHEAAVISIQTHFKG